MRTAPRSYTDPFPRGTAWSANTRDAAAATVAAAPVFSTSRLVGSIAPPQLTADGFMITRATPGRNSPRAARAEFAIDCRDVDRHRPRSHRRDLGPVRLDSRASAATIELGGR